MIGRIVTDPTKCSGCRICEISCSLKYEGAINPKKARLRVVYDVFPNLSRSLIVCRQCKAAPCAKVCPVNAIAENAKLGIPIINEGLCIGCMDCVEACPFGALFVHPDKRVPLKCNLCDGEPLCVKNCPSDALQYVPIHLINQVEKK